jgi:hypothetical protein
MQSRISNSFFYSCFLIACVLLLFGDYYVGHQRGYFDFLHRFDHGRLILPLFSWVLPPTPLFFQLLLALLIGCIACLLFRIYVWAAALVASLVLVYVSISNVVYTFNFHFFSAFTLFYIFVNEIYSIKFNEKSFIVLMRLSFIAIYTTVSLHRLTGQYFDGGTVEREILPLMNQPILSRWIAENNLFSHVAWLTFLSELTVVWGLLRKSFWAGFVFPIYFHFGLALTTALIVPNFFVIAGLVGILLPVHANRITGSRSILLGMLLLPFLAIFVALFFSKWPEYLIGLAVALGFLFFTANKYLRLVNRVAISDCSFVDLGRIGIVLFLLHLLYLTMELWNESVASRRFSYAMYSGKVRAAPLEYFAVVKGIDLSNARYRRNRTTNFGNYPVLFRQQISNAQWMNIEQVIWLPRYLDWICSMPEHKGGKGFESIEIYPGGLNPPDLNVVRPIQVIDSPCTYDSSQRAVLLRSIL